MSRQAHKKVILIGNPNVGKSVIFGFLTGHYVTVSNYPGTTVEVAEGRARYGDRTETVVDTPGINSLLPFSEDEVVTRDILLSEYPRLVVQIADAKNLRRALFLTVQLAEMRLPFVLVLNMMDEAHAQGVKLDAKRLSRQLGVPVVKTVAIKKQGLDDLTLTIQDVPRASSLEVRYAPEVEEAVEEIVALLPETGISRRALALMLLAGDASLKKRFRWQLDPEAVGQIERIRQELEAQLDRPVASVINQRRLQKADEIFYTVFHSREHAGYGLKDRLSAVSMHPVWGFAVLALVLYGLYQFVGVFGAGTLVDFLEETVFGKYIEPALTHAVGSLVPFAWLREMLVGEYGLLTMALSYAVAIVLPVVATFFLAFGLLEDTGYLPRLAVMLNRVFRTLGLNGKAVLPMVLGLGCDTMATLTTRVLESRKERILVTLLLALGIPCSAQLGVILGLLGGLSFSAVWVWLLCISGVLVVVGYLASKVLPGERSDFVMELPPFRRPSLSNIAVKTTARIEWYLKEAVPLFFLGTFVLFLLAKSGGLAVLQKWAAPVVTGFLGLPESTTQAFLVGFLRRDYGAAGLFDLARQGLLTPTQIIVSLVTITLFVPCIANFFVIIKERGWKTAVAITLFIFPLAFLVGGALNYVLNLW